MNTPAKKHPLLGEVTSALSGRLPETTVDVMGTRYRLRLLKPEADDWVAAHTPGSTTTAALLNFRKPTLAAALVSIARLPAPGADSFEDSVVEVPVEQLFGIPAEMDQRAKEALTSDPKLLRDWRREQVLEWMREELDTVVLDQMFDAYSKLIPQHKEAMKQVSGF